MHTTRRWLIGGVAAIALLLLILVVYRPILTLHYQQSAGKWMAPLVLSSSPHYFDSAPCLMPIQNDAGSIDRIEKALADLEKAIKYSPNASQSFLELGKAYCLLGDFPKAVGAYRRYVDLRPKNPLGHMNIGAALLASCWTGSSSDLPRSDVPCGTLQGLLVISNEFSISGVDVSETLSQASISFDHNEFYSADLLFAAANILQADFTATDYFRWGVASILTRHSVPKVIKRINFTVYDVQEDFIIQARDLHWLKNDPSVHLDFGDPLSKFSPSGNDLGVLWWDGRAAVMVNIEQPGTYRLTVRAQDTLGGIQLALEKDLSVVAKFELLNADQSWHDLSATTVFSKGVHLISVNYLIDTGDATLGRVELKRQ